LFKDAGDQTGEAIEKIEKYRTVTGKVLPRILVIIDEFQVLLEKNDKLSRKIKGALEKIIREGRKYGISIVFCTQSYRNIDFDTELITLRIAFNLKEMDSLKVLGSGNDSAAHLTKKGEAILNNSNGEKEANVLFQAAYTEKVQHYVNFCVERWNEFDGEKPKRFVFDGKAVSNIANNVHFVNSLTDSILNPSHIVTWVGVPMFIRATHSFATFRKAIGSNMLICGTDVKAALSTMALVNYQISQSIEDIENSLFITDYFNESSEASQYLRKFAEKAEIPYLPKRELEPVIESIESLLKKRIDDDMAGIENDNTPIVGTIAYIQNAPDMKKNQFNQPSKLMVKIQDILKNGPDYGIHLIVYAYNYKGLVDVMDNAFVSAFGNRIILQGGAVGLQLAQEAETLSEGTAFLVTEDASTTYEQDPVMIYNECRSDALQDDVLDYIFSIYNQ
jgi:DNA segregation ATPase FtsK/SpoIIIE-like protein